MFDLKLIPIHQQQGQPIPQQAGFLAAAPPRRAARSRAEDLLILSFITNGGERLPNELKNAWLENLVETFFKTGGSVTSALRALIETLNLNLMEKNLKSAKEGPGVTGAVNLASIHRHAIYLAQSGFAHAYALTEGGLAHFYDSSQTDRGLGLSRTPTIRYYQADLRNGGYLFMTDRPAETWTHEQLSNGGFPSLEQLRRRLLNQASPNLRLDLVQIMPGEGQIVTVPSSPLVVENAKPSEPVEETSAPEGIAEPDIAVLEETLYDTQKVPQMDIPDLEANADEEPLPTMEDEPEEVPSPVVDEAERPPDPSFSAPAMVDTPVPVDAGVERITVENIDVHKATEKPQAERPQRPPKKSFNDQVEVLREAGLQGLSRFFDWWRKARDDMGTFFDGLLSGMGLKRGEGLQPLSNRTLLLIAVLVPLAVVGFAVSMYLVRGRALQYQYYLDQAEIAAVSAQASEDLDMAHQQWSQAVLFLDQAESYRRTDETREQRAAAQRALDALDGAVRLSYHPAIIGTLPDEIFITRIISYGLDLYLLDANGGRVIHATRGSQGYQVDVDFACRMGNFSGGAVDMLVDMVPLPINNPYQAHILAADASGNVIFCGPGRDPVVQRLPRGDGLHGAVTRIATEGNLLYVLDPSVETVRVYRSTNGQFLDDPTDFFGGAAEGVKPAISPVVDIAVNGAELYLLRGDGRLVHCVASGLPGNPVNCENPVAYVDGRPGKQDQPVALPESRFISVLYTAPPDPAVNILDADQADIFRFSLRFRLHQRMRSDFGNYEVVFPAATAFTIGVDRIAFVAFGHQVFWAYVE